MTPAPFQLPDPIEIEIDLPMPPSTNAIWRGKGKRGVYLSKDYQVWIKTADMHLMATRSLPRRTISGPCEAHILLNIEKARVGSDADNRIKALMDYAQRIELIDNDSLVMKYVVEWAKPALAPIGCRLILRELAG